MVFYMLNKIADCAENVVRNFSHREHFPEAMLRICPGCQTCRTHESVARARRVKRRPRDEATQRHQARHISRRRCCASVRAAKPAERTNL
ncbi:hypothetical protein FML67_19795 [Klebsiella michiganensis]|nr:hypothetical protein [Klebsiella michiganensis]MBZ7916411.1 hypothetical protein [Klebsiella michiganensis]